MEQTTEPLVVRRQVEIAATPETVWELLVDPVKALRWWGVGAERPRRGSGHGLRGRGSDGRQGCRGHEEQPSHASIVRAPLRHRTFTIFKLALT